ncbi:putative CocE/NonD family hydrolase [Virgibacillus natechei]|uniref:CocE/NonD family hydrolase n=1 Tax=Virgibacillus natechei TaxID=1216297 RepID=A0ABS4IBM6_9BACI|nr:CocE/NonD family hydrolase [Virgibacillus natechei]MBP1968332.1 putative CocE/NonD family hydrolase [Virgibacillus natechei]UZD13466.1 CocE/NonD family hydrolase [Virgibacillus natechei]
MVKKNYIFEQDVTCRLSDGTILRGDVYRPDDHEPHPVLMLRLPYDKRTPRYYDEYLEVPRMVQAGYVVILQDVRGRFASGGAFYPFIHEGKDGYESVEWAAKLPYSNGKVGLFGMSYHGYTQLAAAAEKPPALKAIAPVMTMAEPWSDMLDGDCGASDIGNFYTWTLESILPDQLERRGNQKSEKVQAYIEKLPELLKYRPLKEAPPIKELDPNSFFFDVVNQKVSEDTVKRMNLRKSLQEVSIPALFIGGWFDGLLIPTLKAYQAYGGERMLWIGPWTHEAMSGRAGEKFFENSAVQMGVDRVKDPTELHIKWFDKWLKDKPLSIEKPVHLYMAGQKKWQSFEKWPPDTSTIEFFLHSEGAAQSRHGDGRLLRNPSDVQSMNQLKLDPENPVPTRGGGVLLAGHDSGMFEQGDIQDREDVLVFTSEPLAKELNILGIIQAKVWVSSVTPLMDIFVRVSDVEPSNKVYNVVDTFYREPVKNINEPFYINLDINHTAYRFKTGHCVRVEIAASNAPRFDVNLNNGQTSKTASGGEVAFETIYHGDEYPSRLVLPMKEK